VTTASSIRDELLRLSKQMPNSPLANSAAGDVALVDGKVVSKGDPSRSVPIADAMRHGTLDRIEREITTNPGQDARSHNAHSAVFAEVKVDEQLGVIRVTRIVSAVAAGRILNAKTARSQILGSVVWGIGMALREETLIDQRDGRIVNANIAEYLVPVNADLQDIKVTSKLEPNCMDRPCVASPM
jgi:xanthine dehydrogenase YagR molybdenum-binding subunit